MKKLSIFLIVLFAFTSAITFSSCNRTEVKVYDCPMKCEGAASDKAGKCPVCGMDLVKVEKDNTEVGNDSVPTSKPN